MEIENPGEFLRVAAAYDLSNDIPIKELTLAERLAEAKRRADIHNNNNNNGNDKIKRRIIERD